MQTEDRPTSTVLQDEGEASLLAGSAHRAAEEMLVMFVGFGIGITVAGVFLVYVVMSAAGWLQ